MRPPILHRQLPHCAKQNTNLEHTFVAHELLLEIAGCPHPSDSSWASVSRWSALAVMVRLENAIEFDGDLSLFGQLLFQPSACQYFWIHAFSSPTSGVETQFCNWKGNYVGIRMAPVFQKIKAVHAAEQGRNAVSLVTAEGCRCMIEIKLYDLRQK